MLSNIILFILIIYKDYRLDVLKAEKHKLEAIEAGVINEKYYRNRLLYFKEAGRAEYKVVMAGDSITEGVSWQDMLDSLAVINMGIGGDTVEGVLGRIDEICSKKPRIVFLMIGVNDLKEGASVETTFHAYEKILNEFKKRGVKTVIQSTLLLSKDYYDSYSKNDKIKKLNAILKTSCEEKGFIFSDMNQKLCASGYLDDKFTYDGIHINFYGYKIWKEEVLRILTAEKIL